MRLIVFWHLYFSVPSTFSHFHTSKEPLHFLLLPGLLPPWISLLLHLIVSDLAIRICRSIQPPRRNGVFYLHWQFTQVFVFFMHYWCLLRACIRVSQAGQKLGKCSTRILLLQIDTPFNTAPILHSCVDLFPHHIKILVW